MDNPFLKYTGKNGLLVGDLSTLGGSFQPDSFPHRERQIDLMANTLSSILRSTRASNIFLYGKTGTGKTSVTSHVTRMLREATSDGVKVYYVNCQIFDSPYSIMVSLVNLLAPNPQSEIPPLGWPQDRIYLELLRRINISGKFIILVLDEIDKLIKKNGGDALYVLLKLLDDASGSKTSIIGITNDTGFIEGLDARVRSRLNQESVLFPPYNASEIRDILEYRLSDIVKKDVVDEAAINLCAAIGAQEHGDARKAIDLMRISIEMAIRDSSEKVTEVEVMKARGKFELDVLKEAVTTLPLQSKVLLLSAVITQEISNSQMATGEIYENYKSICSELGFVPLSSRRISDILSELEDFGLLTAKTKSMGRYGRTRWIRVIGDYKSIKKYLLSDEHLSTFNGARMMRQTRISGSQEEAEEWGLSSEKDVSDKLNDIANSTFATD